MHKTFEKSGKKTNDSKNDNGRNLFNHLCMENKPPKMVSPKKSADSLPSLFFIPKFTCEQNSNPFDLLHDSENISKNFTSLNENTPNSGSALFDALSKTSKETQKNYINTNANPNIHVDKTKKILILKENDLNPLSCMASSSNSDNSPTKKKTKHYSTSEFPLRWFLLSEIVLNCSSAKSLEVILKRKIDELKSSDSLSYWKWPSRPFLREDLRIMAAARADPNPNPIQIGYRLQYEEISSEWRSSLLSAVNLLKIGKLSFFYFIQGDDHHSLLLNTGILFIRSDYLDNFLTYRNVTYENQRTLFEVYISNASDALKEYLRSEGILFKVIDVNELKKSKSCCLISDTSSIHHVIDMIINQKDSVSIVGFPSIVASHAFVGATLCKTNISFSASSINGLNSYTLKLHSQYILPPISKNVIEDILSLNFPEIPTSIYLNNILKETKEFSYICNENQTGKLDYNNFILYYHRQEYLEHHE